MQEPQETQVQFLGQEDPLEKEMATHSSILVWETQENQEWTEEPGRLQFIRSHKSRTWLSDWARTQTYEHVCIHIRISSSTTYLYITYHMSSSVPNLGDRKTTMIWFLSSNSKHNYKPTLLFVQQELPALLKLTPPLWTIISSDSTQFWLKTSHQHSSAVSLIPSSLACWEPS